jgi:hypothetical protein
MIKYLRNLIFGYKDKWKVSEAELEYLKIIGAESVEDVKATESVEDVKVTESVKDVKEIYNIKKIKSLAKNIYIDNAVAQWEERARDLDKRIWNRYPDVGFFDYDKPMELIKDVDDATERVTDLKKMNKLLEKELRELELKNEKLEKLIDKK